MNKQLKVKSEKLKVVLITACCFLLAFCAYTSQREKMFKKSRILMDTQVTVTIVSASRDSAEKAINAAFSEIEKIESLTNFYAAGSEISLINKNAGISATKVSPEVLELLGKSLSVSEMTDGAFDITIGAVTRLYDFHKKIKPEESTLLKNISLVNYRDVTVDRLASTIFLKKKGMIIDAGGIAKGYAADKAVGVLKKQGITSGLVAIAGDIKAFGRKPDGKPWQIGIRNPRGTNQDDDIMATLPLSDMAISTSGDYERFFLVSGVRYHHLLDPGTGSPAGRCRSVTVIASEATFADSFATAVFVFGPEKGVKALDAAGFDGLIVDSEGKMHFTAGMREKVAIKKPVS
jgi:FAD:protein FMN transferase